MHNHKILNFYPPNHYLQDIFSKELGISPLLAQILINRGVKNLDEADKFLDAKLEHLLDPYNFSDMQQAVDLIYKVARDKEKVMLCGDYDADGITALVILKNTLRKIGIEALHYIPHRIKDGYGLNKNVQQFAKEKKIKLLITADCGISSHKEIKGLRKDNIEVIVTDHHEPEDNLPPASCIINPKVKECNYKYQDLAGVGVAYKLSQAISQEDLVDDLDLVSLGTIADVVPLTGENRIIAKEGLAQLTQAKRIGIKALIEVSRIKDKQINSTFVSFILGPRINASGRIDSAETALKLLMCEDKQEADLLARSLDAHNHKRQKIERQILKEAEDLINREINFKEQKVIVVAKEGWHQGVLGIVASKLAERFYRPTIVISLTDQLCKGSGRSIKNFHLFHALRECKEHLETFGGHSHAVGLLIARDNLGDFKNKINFLASKKLLLEDLIPSLDIDIELKLSDLNESLVKELQVLEPFGTGNPEPLFYSRNLKLKSEVQVLGKETLKFWVTDDEVTHQVIAFGMATFQDSLKNADSLDLVYTVRLDSWQGEDTLLLEAKEIFFR